MTRAWIVVAALTASNWDVIELTRSANRSLTGAARRDGGGPTWATIEAKAPSAATMALARSLRLVMCHLGSLVVGDDDALRHLTGVLDDLRENLADGAHWCGGETEATTHQHHATLSDAANGNSGEVGLQVLREHR